MKLILHDFKPEESKKLPQPIKHKVEVFSATPMIKTCTGCYGCWIKTPGQCVIEDRGQQFLKLVDEADEWHIISRLLYGQLAPEVKAVMDRSIGYMLPFFEDSKGEQHHPTRYPDKKIRVIYHLYYLGDNKPPDDEIETMKKIIDANMLNLSIDDYDSHFYTGIEGVLEGLK